MTAEFNSSRAKKAGIALQIEKKMEERYDEENELGVPDRIIDWMNEVLKGEHQPLEFDRMKGVAWRKFNFWLRDGVALCRLINKLLESEGKEKIKFNKCAHTAFVALENIENFNKGCDRYGVPETALFQSIDLHEGHKGPFLNVINCVNKLGFVANQKEFAIKYISVEAPGRDDVWGDK